MLVAVVATAQSRKPRVVITADPELDDNNTIIRFTSAWRYEEEGRARVAQVDGRAALFYLAEELCAYPGARINGNERFTELQLQNISHSGVDGCDGHNIVPVSVWRLPSPSAAPALCRILE